MEFTYHPLTRNSTEIRLVRLLGHSCQNTPLSLELCHASINDIKYAALSYVWGDVTSTVEIVLDNLSFRIGRNLYAALKQLQQNNFHGWLWIDSVCIQQSDLGEKSYQVGLMGTIFSKADCVFSWLGQGTPGTDRALDFVSRVGPRALELGTLDFWARDGVADWRVPYEEICACLRNLPDTKFKWFELAQFILDVLSELELQLDASHDQDLMSGIDELLARDYWCRVWINQEVGLAKKVVIMCGTKVLTLDTFDATFKALKACKTWYADVRSDTGGFGEHWTTWNFYCLLPMEVRDHCIRGGKIPLAELLYREHGRFDRPLLLATDPRDVVFGLLGVISVGDSLGIQHDYNTTVAQTFATVTKAFLDQEHQSLSGYNFVSLMPRFESENPHNLPSWVPDWQNVGQGKVHGHPIMSGWCFNATPYTVMQIRPLVGSGDTLRVLRQRGCHVDVITDVMTPPKTTGDDGNEPSTGDISESWTSAAIVFTNLGSEPNPGEDYVWRTLIDTRHEGVEREYAVDENKALIRDFMRGREVDSSLLSPTQIGFVKHLLLPSQDLDTLSGLLRYSGKHLREIHIRRLDHRTLFKTAKGMFGMCYRVVQPGDVVTLLWGIKAPVILRPRGGGGFTYQGDAYVDGIMHGEFMQTDPAPEDFHIH